ncbi:tetratricopeptide repeat protein [Odoribacter sp. OttesenSCG-928-G04]|nr:tetratricopeptide repeat protein [Odoribacter sp. OttesenSCG-928-G04]MDL2330594.1 tetratricopeptide repeat protein [Odoribacter sp. OttesenSCG-928-A06]
MRPLLTILLLVISITTAIAQPQSDSQLAYEYYRKKEYGKAAELFIQLYERTKSSHYLDYYIVSLINNKEYDKAEENLKKFLKVNESNKDYLINLGYIYMQQGKVKKAEETFKKALDKLQANNNDISSLASRFRNIREYDWSNKTYLKGRELLKNPDAYVLEIGDNYMFDRNYHAMIDQFTDYLDKNPGKINQITSKLNSARMYDVNKSVDTIIGQHLNSILSKPGYNPVFDELSVWLSIQKGDFANAYTYAVKFNSKVENRYDLYLNIAREARQKKEYSIATKAYRNILEAGKENNSFYNAAAKEILFSKYDEYSLTEQAASNFHALADESKNYVATYGFSDVNTDIILLLADIYSYKLELADSAEHILQQGINISRLSQLNSSRLKSKRADILAYLGNPWEATILYTQVEKANPNNDIGYEAKLKKAWMAYYEGDLLWANAQFSVLKGATSKLIANDALKISHFIGMNYAPEEDNSALEKTAQAEYLIYRKMYPEAMQLLDSVIGNATQAISDYALLQKAHLHIKQQEPQKAMPILAQLKKENSEVYIQAEAIYLLAGLEIERNEKEKALELYKTLITDYSGSVYSVDAARIYREIEP